jgi:hypothetical protein
MGRGRLNTSKYTYGGRTMKEHPQPAPCCHLNNLCNRHLPGCSHLLQGGGGGQEAPPQGATSLLPGAQGRGLYLCLHIHVVYRAICDELRADHVQGTQEATPLQ